MITELSPNQLRLNCDPLTIHCASSAEAEVSDAIIGQERAVRAIRFGLDIKELGFNIFVAGAPGTGRTTAVERYLEETASGKPIPKDWCYVHNFEDNYHPHAISLPAKMARQYQKDMDGLLKSITSDLSSAFESDQYDEQRENTLKSFQAQKEGMIEKLSESALSNGFALQATPIGILPVPLKDDKPMRDEDFLALNESEREKVKKAQEKVQASIDTVLRQTRALDNNAHEALNELDHQLAIFVLDRLLAPLLEKYKDLPEVIDHFQAIKNDIVESISKFKPKAERDDRPIPIPRGTLTDKYRVNVLVDNSKLQGAPVIVEMNPTYSNLFGRIEQEAYMGALVTDFMLIRGGSIHRANGGYLVLPAEDAIRSPFTWESLKRCLRNREITIEEPVELNVFTTRSLRPEAIPLDVKVILIGSPTTYQLLLAYDEQFDELFKVKADFDLKMERSEAHIQDYASFVCRLCDTENLTHLDSTGLAKIVEYGSRLADDQEKLSSRFGEISDVIREASYYARLDKAELVKAEHIEKATEERFYRSNLLDERIREMIAKGVIKIDVAGAKIGQVNGLSVVSLGDIAFGQPSRITASVGLGENGVVNVEREAAMSGPTHTKGVLILSGYLAQQFAQDKPLSLNAHLVFEQNYGGVDGDSASSTELYAILSALADVPINQSIAVTGSVNQKGEVQAIGGVNEKIEGFFAVCNAKGLTGEQGVMIPASNVTNLMLKQQVVDAVAGGQFHIWSVTSIEDGIEVLTGMPAGKDAEGKFTPEGLYARIDNRLTKMADDLATFNI